MKKHLILALCTALTLTAHTDPIVVYYSDHGAKGNGITDDFEAIYQAHKFANEQRIVSPEKRVIVRGTPNANYFIGAKHSNRTILIQTGTDWTDVTFTIDDREVPHQNARVWLFRVESALPEIEPERYRAMSAANEKESSFGALPNRSQCAAMESKTRAAYLEMLLSRMLAR